MLLLSTQDSRSFWSISHTAIARPLILYTDEPLDYLGTVSCKRNLITCAYIALQVIILPCLRPPLTF
jgi:hypothetical protein